MAAYFSFMILMIILCITDISYYFIPNWIVLPGIILGGLLTGHWMPAIVMFCIGAFLFKKRLICGGDVKLLAMVGSFMGMKAILVFALSKVIIYFYRKIKQDNTVLPYTPFVWVASIPFLFL